MRSRRNDDLSSFELLLDTMCNTFGGIVFIALLLSILSQSIEITTQSDINTQFHTPKTDLYKKIEKVRLNLSLKDEQEHLEKSIRKNFDGIESVKKDIKTIEKDIEHLNKSIASSKKLQTRKLRMPKLHPTNKSPVFIAIKHGRFYAITNIAYSITNLLSDEWGNSVRGYDTSDIFIREYQNITTIELISGRGQVIENRAELSGKIQQAVLNINPAKEFITFAVYPDSFAEFNYVKEIFINKGFDYNWFIIKNNLSLVKGAGKVHAQ
ncbi:MAG: hypothetical protein HQK73_11540 [Desulfamplus sp.]|nr:hypothetical protein [Desulfamplus sp.]